MKYEYREVKCPWCDHVFMWNKNNREGLFIHTYRLKESRKFVEEATCPKCEMKMLVLDKIFEGMAKQLHSKTLNQLYSQIDL